MNFLSCDGLLYNPGFRTIASDQWSGRSGKYCKNLLHKILHPTVYNMSCFKSVGRSLINANKQTNKHTNKRNKLHYIIDILVYSYLFLTIYLFCHYFCFIPKNSQYSLIKFHRFYCIIGILMYLLVQYNCLWLHYLFIYIVLCSPCYRQNVLPVDVNFTLKFTMLTCVLTSIISQQWKKPEVSASFRLNRKDILLSNLQEY